MVRVHDNAGSGNAYKVRLLLTQLGIPFERLEYDTDRGATRTPAFLSTKNPNGRIPVLELEDGRCLAESNAILWYLAEGNRSSRARTTPRWSWHGLDRVLQDDPRKYSHEPHIATLRNWITHGLEMTPERQAAAPGKRKWGDAALAVMEAQPEPLEVLVAIGATPSRTSRSTRTRTSPARGASTLRLTRPCAPGSRASRPSRDTSRSRHRRAPASPPRTEDGGRGLHGGTCRVGS